MKSVMRGRYEMDKKKTAGESKNYYKGLPSSSDSFFPTTRFNIA